MRNTSSPNRPMRPAPGDDVAGTFHAGEMALQREAGSADLLAQVGPRVVRDQMPQQHRAFFAQLPFLVVGALDDAGQPWAGLVVGPPGFITSPHERRLQVAALPLAIDPLRAGLLPGAPVGLLGIEPHTRRRNRMNGVVDSVEEEGFSVAVGQSFGNCPKYIQARRPEYVAGPLAPPALHLGVGLDDPMARRAVALADTFFIASAHPRAGSGLASQGVDVSHRGGKPGFVRVQGDVLTVPDFAGNNFFNTLGNLLLNPLCGLVFMDFETGGMLQLAARAQIVADGAELRAFAGAERLLRLEVLSTRRTEGALRLRWGQAERSPYLAATGTWV